MWLAQDKTSGDLRMEKFTNKTFNLEIDNENFKIHSY